MIAVNGELEQFPHVRAMVQQLDDAEMLRYVEVADWLEGVTDCQSPEGHEWGTEALRNIGTILAELVRP